MSSVPLHYVELRAFSYATEDDGRVERALRTLLPEEVELEGTVTEGHHGDRIVVFSARVETAEEMRAILDRILTLPADELAAVRADLDERIDEDCNLYLTFSKQAAFEGDVRRGDGITFRAKVEAYPAKHDAAVENARDLFPADPETADR